MARLPAGCRLYKGTTASASYPSPHRYSVDTCLTHAALLSANQTKARATNHGGGK